jgi:uncharacterized membrane protein required for colicin V production
MMACMQNFNVIDIVIFLYLLFGIVRGVKRGLSGEIARLAGIVVAVWAGWRFYEPLGERIFLTTRLGEQSSYALAFFLALILAFVLMVVLRILLRHVMEFTFKGKLERIGGAVAGLLRSTAVVLAVVIFMSLVPHDYLHALFVEESLVGRTLYVYLPTIYDDLAERYPKLPALWDRERGEEPAGETWE